MRLLLLSCSLLAASCNAAPASSRWADRFASRTGGGAGRGRGAGRGAGRGIGRAASPLSSVLLSATGGSSPTDPSVVSVLDFGAVGDGAKDNTGPFQAALSSLAASGGTVIVPDGNFSFLGSLTFPPSVALQGTFASVPSHEVAQGASIPNRGSILLVRGGRGNAGGAPFMTLTENCAVRGLVFYYPENVRGQAPAAYPYAIALTGNNPAVEVSGCAVEEAGAPPPSRAKKWLLVGCLVTACPPPARPRTSNYSTPSTASRLWAPHAITSRACRASPQMSAFLSTKLTTSVVWKMFTGACRRARGAAGAARESAPTCVRALPSQPLPITPPLSRRNPWWDTSAAYLSHQVTFGVGFLIARTDWEYVRVC